MQKILDKSLELREKLVKNKAAFTRIYVRFKLRCNEFYDLFYYNSKDFKRSITAKSTETYLHQSAQSR